jgi:lipoyl(octanoyl) transferase
MKAFTGNRSADSPDEIWLLQHAPVFTQGQSCSDVPVGHEHIPVVHSDRGGQITYHGPGQLIVYLLIDLRRRKIGIKSMVRLLEQCVIDYLAAASIVGERRADAPGVYVGGKKIAALGLRVRRGACYHGLSFNIDMDLFPFSSIEPCGYRDLEVTQLKDLGVTTTLELVQEDLTRRIRRELKFTP